MPLNHRTSRVLCLPAALALAGCVSTSAVLDVGRDTYSVSSTADGYRTASAARESAFQAGSDRCTSLSKHFMLVSESAAPTRMGIDTTVTVVFRCLAETDPAYGRPEPPAVP